MEKWNEKGGNSIEEEINKIRIDLGRVDRETHS